VAHQHIVHLRAISPVVVYEHVFRPMRFVVELRYELRVQHQVRGRHWLRVRPYTLYSTIDVTLWRKQRGMSACTTLTGTSTSKRTSSTSTRGTSGACLPISVNQGVKCLSPSNERDSL
jgi:hypothetical protein